MVGIYHHCPGIIRRAEESFQGIEPPADGGGFGTNHRIVGIGVLRDADHGVGTLQSVDNHKSASIGHLMVGCKVSAHQEVDMLNCLVVMKFNEGFLSLFEVFTRQEKVYFFSHFRLIY